MEGDECVGLDLFESWNPTFFQKQSLEICYMGYGLADEDLECIKWGASYSRKVGSKILYWRMQRFCTS